MADEALGNPHLIEQALLLAATFVATGLRAVMDAEDAPGDGSEPGMDDAGWEAVAWTGGEFLEMDLPGDDRATLNAIALRKMTTRQATWLSRQDLGLVADTDQPRMRQEIAEDQRGTPAGWEPFPGQPGSGQGGGHGHGLADEPSGNVPGDQRPGAAPAGGRGAGGLETSDSGRAGGTPTGRVGS
jgi:hypothetical protein